MFVNDDNMCRFLRMSRCILNSLSTYDPCYYCCDKAADD